jgi:two-component system, cell cycle sensor histidine kinase and response regulator CckA
VEPENTELLPSAVQFLPEAVLLTEAGAGVEKMIFANQAFQQMVGYSMEEMRGRDLTMFQGRETDGETLHRLLHSSREEDLRVKVLLYKKDGTPFWDGVSTCRLPAGNRVYSVQAHSDITQQQEIESQFILSQKREATSHLVSGLTHDFNNLLTAIMVYSGLMASKVHSDSQLKRYLDEVRASAERGAKLVAELMNLGRQDAAEPELVDVSELVDESGDLLRRIIGEDIQLSVERAPDLGKIRAHPGRIQQVLLNLVINARDAMPHGGELIIKLSNLELLKDDLQANDLQTDDLQPDQRFAEAVPGNYLLLAVTDTGVGMDLATQANIFKPFFSTKGKGKGSGLGLFTVHTIVKQAGGHIYAESEPGKGAKFIILLPFARDREVTTGGGRATLLLVEDEELVRRSLEVTLSLRGYNVLSAANAEEALHIARKHPEQIHVLLTDLLMPDVSGPELVQRIHKIRPGIRVLLMSGNSNAPRLDNLSQVGGIFVKKPFTTSVLVQKIEQLLNKPSDT